MGVGKAERLFCDPMYDLFCDFPVRFVPMLMFMLKQLIYIYIYIYIINI